MYTEDKNVISPFICKLVKLCRFGLLRQGKVHGTDSSTNTGTARANKCLLKFLKHFKLKSEHQRQYRRHLVYLNLNEWVAFCFSIAFMLSMFTINSSRAERGKLVLYRDQQPLNEVNTRECKAGVYLANPATFDCACVTGIWAFYSKYCKKPIQIVGGNNYCFKLGSENIAQVIPIGNIRYPFQSSITHFREDFIIMTRAYVTDDDTLDIDAISSEFITVAGEPWTIKGDNGETVCLDSSDPGNKNIYCLFGHNPAAMAKWNDIIEVSRGCSSTNVLAPYSCFEIFQNLNGSNICEGNNGNDLQTTSTAPPSTTTEQMTTTTPATTTEQLTTTTPEPTTTTTERPKVCSENLFRETVKAHWDPNQKQRSCSPSITDATLTDQLKRYATFRMNKVVKTRQKSLSQMTELLKIHANLTKITCPSSTVWPEFIDAMTNAFEMLMREDFFYGVQEFRDSLFERILFSFKTCLSSARTFNFVQAPGRCNVSLIVGEVIIDQVKHTIPIETQDRWDEFEPIIEAIWKMFLNAHSYCYQHFQRLNDHHSYALTFLRLFSNSIYEKWVQPLLSFALYQFVVPNRLAMYEIMNNLEYCVGAVSFVSGCPVWMSRRSTRPISTSAHKRKKRTIWAKHLQENRDVSDIWDGTGFCLTNAEDPSYYLGFGTCGHP